MSQGAVQLASAPELIGAQEARENGRQQELCCSLVSLAYWSDLLQTGTAELGKLPFYPVTDTWVSDLNVSSSEVCVEWPANAASKPLHPFISTCNRWSHGFH